VRGWGVKKERVGKLTTGRMSVVGVPGVVAGGAVEDGFV